MQITRGKTLFAEETLSCYHAHRDTISGLAQSQHTHTHIGLYNSYESFDSPQSYTRRTKSSSFPDHTICVGFGDIFLNLPLVKSLQFSQLGGIEKLR